MSRKKLIRICLIIASYCLASVLVAGIATTISLYAFQQRQFSVSIASSAVARGLVFPFTILSLPDQPNMFALWYSSLILIQQGNELVELTQQEQFSFTSQTISLPFLQDSEKLSSIHRQTEIIDRGLKQRGPVKSVVKRVFPQSWQKAQRASETSNELTALAEIMATEFSPAEQKKRYLILFQNENELRPTGGFMGSYALIEVENHTMQSMRVQDIYVPDGQLDGHVDPPQPIQEAFQQGFWKLRDANWHPDFPRSAQNVQWFYSQAMEENLDGVFAINIEVIEQLVEIIGPIYLPEYQQTVDADSLYTFLQVEAERDFFPGSTQKKNVLQSFTTQLFIKISESSPQQFLKIAETVLYQADQKNVLFYFSNADTQAAIDRYGWTGRLGYPACDKDDCPDTYFSIYEANLGVNKSNCCVERTINYQVTETEDIPNRKIELQYKNLGPTEALTEKAGDYKSYVRIYLEPGVEVEQLEINNISYDQFVSEGKTEQFFHPITADSFSQSSVQGLSELGFWIYVEEGKTTTVSILYKSEISNNQLFIQKQPGTKDSFNQFRLNDGQQTQSFTLYKDTLIPFPFF